MQSLQVVRLPGQLDNYTIRLLLLQYNNNIYVYYNMLSLYPPNESPLASRKDAAPVYSLRGGQFERFLYFDAEGHWRVGSAEYKDQARIWGVVHLPRAEEKAAAGSMRSADPVRPGTLPTLVSSWTVRTGYDDWQMQDVGVQVHQNGGYGSG